MSTQYRVPVKDYFEWQSKVKSKTVATPPLSPTKGDRYILPSAGLSGVWVGHENAIAEYNGSAWFYIAPATFFTIWVEDVVKQYYWNGSVWGLVVSSDEQARRYALLVGGN